MAGLVAHGHDEIPLAPIRHHVARRVATVEDNFTVSADDEELARQNRLTRWLVIAIGGLLGVLVTSLAMRFFQ